MREFYEWCADAYDQTFTLLDDDETWRPDLPDSVYPLNKHYWYTTCGHVITGNYEKHPHATIAVVRGRTPFKTAKRPLVTVYGSGVFREKTMEGLIVANEDGQPGYSKSSLFSL